MIKVGTAPQPVNDMPGGLHPAEPAVRSGPKAGTGQDHETVGAPS